MEDRDWADWRSENDGPSSGVMQIDPPPPDPRLVAVQEAAAALKAALSELPATPSRGYAISHADAALLYAAQAIREEG